MFDIYEGSKKTSRRYTEEKAPLPEKKKYNMRPRKKKNLD